MRWGLIIVGVVLAGAQAEAASTGASLWTPEVATPAGITLQYLAPAKTRAGFFVQGITARGNTIGYGGANGKTLYTFDKDVIPGQSTCLGDCAAQWPPAAVPAGAESTGPWTVIERQDGVKQWAYRGKPLYACAKDSDVGEAKCAGADEGAWHTALFRPTEGMPTPPGIRADHVPAAGGHVLATATGMTLYVFTGASSRQEAACTTVRCKSPWIPIAAAELANATGDFTILVGADGSRQWAFRGKRLYRYARDIEIGDVTGVGVDGNWVPAVVVRNFMPPNTGMIRPLGHADILTTGTGMTLYKRDESYQLVTGHGLPHSAPTIPAMGRAIGTKGCAMECLEVWRPFVAPADAHPSSFWEIATRPDGTRQWTYQGYALYTYGRDKKPGDLTGDQIYNVAVNDGEHPDVPDFVPTTNGAALYWSYVEP